MEEGNNTYPAFDILYTALKHNRFETGFDCYEFGKTCDGYFIMVRFQW